MPTVSGGRLAVVTVIAALTTMESALVAVALTVSVARAVKFDAPDAVGVPVIAPLAASRDNPAGRLPEEMDHVRAPVPPVAASVWL